MLEIKCRNMERFQPTTLQVSDIGFGNNIDIQINTHYTKIGIELTQQDVKLLIEHLQEQIKEQEEMDCKQEERIAEIELRLDRIETYESMGVTGTKGIECRLMEEPELKASDFPCLVYFDNQISFTDGNVLYQSTINETRSRKLKISTKDWITNDNIRVEKCKFIEIKNNDYFIFAHVPRDNVNNYFYCGDTRPDKDETVILQARGRIMESFTIKPLSLQRDYDVYRFTLK